MGEDNLWVRIVELIYKLLGNLVIDWYIVVVIFYSLMCVLFIYNLEMCIVKYVYEWVRGWISECGSDCVSVGVIVWMWEWLCEWVNVYVSEWIVCFRDKIIFLMIRILIVFVLLVYFFCYYEDYIKVFLIIVKVINNF